MKWRTKTGRGYRARGSKIKQKGKKTKVEENVKGLKGKRLGVRENKDFLIMHKFKTDLGKCKGSEKKLNKKTTVNV